MTVGTREAARATGVTPRTIRRWVAGGDITNHGTPRRVRVNLTEVEMARIRRALRRALDT